MEFVAIPPAVLATITAQIPSLNANLEKIRATLKMAAAPTVEADYNALLPILTPAEIKSFGTVISKTYMGFVAQHLASLVKDDPVAFADAFKARFSSGRIIIVPGPADCFAGSATDKFTLTEDGSLLVQVKSFGSGFGPIFSKQIQEQLQVGPLPYIVDLNIRNNAVKLTANLEKTRVTLKMAAAPTLEADFNTLLPILTTAEAASFGQLIGDNCLGKFASHIAYLVKDDPVAFADTFKARFSSGRIIMVPGPDSAFAGVWTNKFTLTDDGSLLWQVKSFGQEFQTPLKNIREQLQIGPLPYIVDLNIRNNAATLNANMEKLRVTLKMATAPTLEADFNLLRPLMTLADVPGFGERIGGRPYAGNFAIYFGLIVKAVPSFPEAFGARFTSGRIVLVPALSENPFAANHRFSFTADGSLLVEVKEFGQDFQTALKTDMNKLV